MLSKMKISTFFVLSALILFSCEQDDFGPAQIRIMNSSNIDFDEVIVNIAGTDHNYSELNAGEVSDYITFEKAYRYAYIEVSGGDQDFILQPVDYVGEKPLSEGKYTYDLDLLDGQSLTLALIKDE